MYEYLNSVTRNAILAAEEAALKLQQEEEMWADMDHDLLADMYIPCSFEGDVMDSPNRVSLSSFQQ
jgi:hypothetical protein